jgi:hypothetical protein
MIDIISSKAAAPNSALKEVQRRDNEDNLQWLRRNMPSADAQTQVMLVGGTSTTSFRLRVAQSHVRNDLLPSYWSHVMWLDKVARTVSTTVVYEISLEPPQGFAFPPPTNGIQQGKLSQYRDPQLYPNIAVLAVPVALPAVLQALNQFQKQRAVLDAVDLIVRWLASVWGVSLISNQLLYGDWL